MGLRRCIYTLGILYCGRAEQCFRIQLAVERWRSQTEKDTLTLNYNCSITRLQNLETQLTDERVKQENRGMVSDAFLHWWARFKASTRSVVNTIIQEELLRTPESNRIRELLNTNPHPEGRASPCRQKETECGSLSLEQERLSMDSNHVLHVVPRVLTFEEC